MDNKIKKYEKKTFLDIAGSPYGSSKVTFRISSSLSADAHFDVVITPQGKAPIKHRF